MRPWSHTYVYIYIYINNDYIFAHIQISQHHVHTERKHTRPWSIDPHHRSALHIAYPGPWESKKSRGDPAKDLSESLPLSRKSPLDLLSFSSLLLLSRSSLPPRWSFGSKQINQNVNQEKPPNSQRKNSNLGFPAIKGKNLCFPTFLPFRAPGSSFYALTLPKPVAASVHKSEVWLLNLLRLIGFPHSCCWCLSCVSNCVGWYPRPLVVTCGHT